MKWVLFTGTWRLTNSEVEQDVRSAVREVISHGNGMLSGGATGVDYFALDEALKLNPSANQIKIIIPAYLEDYIKDVYDNWCTAPITTRDVDALAELLRKLKSINSEALVEMPNHTITQHDYDMRNEEEVRVTDEVYAFQVNNSTGTQYTVDYAKSKGLPVLIHKKYQITE